MRSSNATFFLSFFLLSFFSYASQYYSKDKFALRRQFSLLKYSVDSKKNMPFIRGFFDFVGEQIVLSNNAKKSGSETVSIHYSDPNVSLLSSAIRKKFGGSPLHNAVKQGNLEAVKLFLGNGACASIIAQTGEKGHWDTPLHLAVKSRGSSRVLAIIKALRIAGADPNVGGGDHECIPLTPLMILAIQGNFRPNVVKALCAFNQLDINKQSNDKGKTALFIAAERGNVEMVRMLLSYRARVDDCNSNNSAPFKQAISHGHIGAARVLCNAQANPHTGAPSAMETLLFKLYSFKGSQGSSKEFRRHQKLLVDILSVYPIKKKAEDYKLIIRAVERYGLETVFNYALRIAQKRRHQKNKGLVASSSRVTNGKD